MNLIYQFTISEGNFHCISNRHTYTKMSLVKNNVTGSKVKTPTALYFCSATETFCRKLVLWLALEWRTMFTRNQNDLNS